MGLFPLVLALYIVLYKSMNAYVCCVCDLNKVVDNGVAGACVFETLMCET